MNSRQTVFVVDDDQDLLRYLARLLSSKGYEVVTASSGAEALERLRGGFLPTVMILDLMLPEVDGMTILAQAKILYKDLPVVIVTAHGATKNIIEAVKLGAYDYLVKPFEPAELEVSLKNALEKKELIEEVTKLKEKVGEREEDEEFVTASEAMLKIKEKIRQISDTDVTILIQGESGVGKEVIARYVHAHSHRRNKPFVKINCAALPTELLESELFGYEKGAFTGAFRTKPGKFEIASGGTILLDEIADMSLPLQAKLLQVLQDGTFARLGGQKDVKADARVIAATNKNLEACVKNMSFREDLYYRLNIIDVYVPPLRERKEDILLLTKYLLEKYNKKYNGKMHNPSEQLLKLFMAYDWPGNVRELENVIKKLILLGDEAPIIEEIYRKISQRAVQQSTPQAATNHTDLKRIKKGAALAAEREIILNVLKQTKWNRSKAAEILNISYKALLYKMKDCGIKPPPGVHNKRAK